MKEFIENKYHLIDAHQRWVGEIEIERIEDNLILGTFTPGPDFPAVAAIFQKFEDAVNAQVLSVLDELDAEIAALGLRLCSPNTTKCSNVDDVQIWSDRNFTCRLAGAEPVSEHNFQKYWVNGQLLETMQLPHS
jgi:hypothetical protein